MPCFHPRTVWLPRSDLGNGRRLVFRQPVDGSEFDEISIACRKCEGCRLTRAREFGIRAAHEAKMHADSCFVTLTYSPEHLPFRGMLKRQHYLDFVQDLRNQERDKRLRFLGVGEYGTLNWRPHYHVCVFGHWFADAVPAGPSSRGYACFESKTLTDLWGKGRCVINIMGAAVAEYAARYSLKKVGSAGDGYVRRDPVSGEEYTLPPEFMSSSKQLGRAWLERYPTDVFPHDYVVTEKGQKVAVPQYYLRVLGEWCAEDLEALKARRLEARAGDMRRFRDGTVQRLAVREECLAARLLRATRRDL